MNYNIRSQAPPTRSCCDNGCVPGAAAAPSPPCAIKGRSLLKLCGAPSTPGHSGALGV